MRYAIESSRDVSTNYEKIVEVASWMAFEELPMPEFALPVGLRQGDGNDAIDFILVADSIDTAFTDFARHEVFQVDYDGKHWSDAEAEFACLERAIHEGVPILNGDYLARITRAELESIFTGNIPMPMLDEKLRVLQEVGGVLAANYDGRFHKFVQSCTTTATG